MFERRRGQRYEPGGEESEQGADRSPPRVITASNRIVVLGAREHNLKSIDVEIPRLRLIATPHDPAVIRQILAHLGLTHSGQSPGSAPAAPSAAAR